jgi:ring-1,2-phenylacetyl-CoA epoxidase subunit PaaB
MSDAPISDTQWPRFELFQQERPGKAHVNVGSVHAPDSEMALLNGRDVFVRRPECHNLWATPADQIFAKTAEELAADDSWRNQPIDSALRPQTYRIFQKQTQRRSMNYVTYVGDVTARTAVEALQLAQEKFDAADASATAVFVWWVIPAAAIYSSDPAEIESMFQPAHSKTYRQPQEYRTVSQMQEIKRTNQP